MAIPLKLKKKKSTDNAYKKITFSKVLPFHIFMSFSGSARVFEGLDSDPALVRTIDAHSPVGRIIQLKVGAQVLCAHMTMRLHETFLFWRASLMAASVVSAPPKVMLTKNLDVARGLVNGARGVVVDFESGKRGICWLNNLLKPSI